MRAGFDLTNTSKLATDSRELMQSKWYTERWGSFVFDRLPGRASGAGEYWNAFGGFSKCGTIQSGAFVGRHARYMIVDDPIKGQTMAAADPALIRAAREWFTGVAITRGSMGEPQRMLVVAQRFHEQDLNGLLIETYADDPKFAHVMLPWHYEPERAYSTPWGRDRRTKEGEELFNNPTQRAAVKTLLRAGPDNPTYRAQYQQDPGSGKAEIFPADTLLNFTGAPDFRECLTCIVVDPTFTGKERSDFMAIDVWGFKDGHFWCFYSEWVKRGFVDAYHAIRKVREQWPALNIVIESTANGPALIEMLKKEGVYGVVGVTPQEIAQKANTNDNSKRGRAAAASFYFHMRRVHFDHAAPWFEGKKRYMTRFPGGTHDDAVDTAVMGVVWLQAQYGGGAVLRDAMQVIADDAAQEQDARNMLAGILAKTPTKVTSAPAGASVTLDPFDLCSIDLSEFE
jgi:phage terminase large subunit-like protein